MSSSSSGQLPLAGKRALVVGGSSGIGLATAKAMAARGATIAIASRDAGRLRHALQELRTTSPDAQVQSVELDLAISGPEELGESIRVASESLDILAVTVAAPAAYGPLADLDVADIEAAFSVKFFGVLRLVQAVLPLMRGTDDAPGTLTLVAGNAGAHPGASNLQTATVNAALSTAATSLAAQLAPNIRVISVSPGPTDTDRFRALTKELFANEDGRSPSTVWPNMLRDSPAMPSEVGELIAWLCSPEARSINGVEIVADGGWIS